MFYGNTVVLSSNFSSYSPLFIEPFFLMICLNIMDYYTLSDCINYRNVFIVLIIIIRIYMNSPIKKEKKNLLFGRMILYKANYEFIVA